MAKVIMRSSNGSTSSEVVLDEATSSAIDEVFTSKSVESASEGEGAEQVEPYAAAEAPALYSGGAYYTPMYTNENFYTPWGTSSLQTGYGYIKATIGGITLAALLAFALPYVLDLIVQLIDWLKKAIH